MVIPVCLARKSLHFCEKKESSSSTQKKILMRVYREVPCVVCKNKEKPLYKFPADEEYKLKWCEAIKLKREQLTSKTKICIRHFSKNQLVNIRLKHKVVPWLNLPPVINQHKEAVRNDDRRTCGDVESSTQNERRDFKESSTGNEQPNVATFVIYEYFWFFS